MRSVSSVPGFPLCLLSELLIAPARHLLPTVYVFYDSRIPMDFNSDGLPSQPHGIVTYPIFILVFLLRPRLSAPNSNF